jgi:uncharacterized membrane protein
VTHRHALAPLARISLFVAALTWAALVPLAPWLGRLDSPVAVVLATSAYATGSLVCHQDPARSFHAAGAQFPVCARCTGLYESAALGALAWLVVGPPIRRRSSSPGSVTACWRYGLASAAVPTLVTVVLEVLGFWHPSSAIRAVAAVPLGLVAGAILTEFSCFG